MTKKKRKMHQGLWPSGPGRVSLPLHPRFKSQHARLSPPRYLTCLLGSGGATVFSMRGKLVTNTILYRYTLKINSKHIY